MKHRPHQHRMPPPAPIKVAPLVATPLTDAEKEQVKHVRNSVHALCPEAVPFVQSLVANGLIHGWRDVGEGRLLQKVAA